MSSRLWDFGFLELYSVFQSPGFRIPQTKLISRIPEFLFLYDKRSHRAKLQMAYCDEKKQNGWKSTKTQPTDVTLFVGMAFAQVIH